MTNVFEFIKTQENKYQTQPVPVAEGYEWNMFDHVRTTTLYLNSRYKTGNQDNTPFRQIILPIRNLTHRAMDFMLKEIEVYVNSQDKYHLSFLARKYHDNWATENNVPNFLDTMTETYDDYGGVLIENTQDGWGVVPFQQLAFCDQTDIMSGPICRKHQFSPDQLKEMEKRGWGKSSNGATATIDEVITLVSKQRSDGEKGNGQMQTGSQKAQTPGQYIEVYDLEGTLPESFLDPEADEHKYTYQFQAVTFYYDQKGDKQWITLFAGKKKPGRYKFKKRDDEDSSTYGRALGRGGVEELFEAQVWTNYNEIQKKELLDHAAKILYNTVDQAFKGRNVSEYDSGEITTSTQPLTQVNNSKPDVVAFENNVQSWISSAKEIGSAYPSMTGEEPKSGMPFALGRMLNTEAHSLHRYRKSKLGNWLAFEVYPDWFIPKFKAALNKGQKFLSTLTLDELQEVAESAAKCQFNEKIKDTLLGKFTGKYRREVDEDGNEYDRPIYEGPTGIIEPGEAEEMFDLYKQEFMKAGTKRFIEILKDEFKDLEIIMRFNITNEQKDQAVVVEKMSAIWSQITQILMANPNFFTQHPEMAKLFNEIIESSGLSPLMFGMSGYNKQLTQPNAQPVQSPANAGGQAVPVQG